MRVGGAIFGIVGALAAFPRRLAAREVERQGGVLRRGLTRRTTHVVFGRTLLETAAPAEIAARYESVRASGGTALSEAAFLRLLGIATLPPATGIPEASLIEKSCLSPRDFALLKLFDAFEHAAPPYSFRDLVLARKYAGLIAGGAEWAAIARSVHRSGEVALLAGVPMQVAGRGIYAVAGERLSELDGQVLLPLEEGGEARLEQLFAEAEQAEAGGRHLVAAELYRQCLAADPGDAVAAFNRANCLSAAGRRDEAAHAYAEAIKRDPEFVEAWFNYAGLLKAEGRIGPARRHLERAIEIDPDYADAIYNLAALEYEAGRLAEALRLWQRYLQLDPDSEWARTATRGIRYAERALSASRQAH